MTEGKKDNKGILIYLLICFLLTYAIEIAVIVPMMERAKNGGSQAMTTSLMALVMLVPALSALITRLITAEGFRDHMILFDIRGKGRYYIIAWFLTPLLIAAGAVAYFLIFRERFDPDMKYILDTYEASTGVRYDAAQMRATILSQTAAGVLLGPVLNCITCFGEEWGWRAYLLPRLMRRFNTLTAVGLLFVEGYSLWS